MTKQPHKEIPHCLLPKVVWTESEVLWVVAPGEAVCVGRREGCSPPGSGVKEAEGPVQRTVRQPSNTKAPGRRELVNVRDYEKSMCSHDTFLLDLIGVFHNNFFYSLEYRKDLESSID